MSEHPEGHRCLSCATDTAPDGTVMTDTAAIVDYLRQIAREVPEVHCTDCIATALAEHADMLATVAEGLAVAAGHGAAS